MARAPAERANLRAGGAGSRTSRGGRVPGSGQPAAERHWAGGRTALARCCEQIGLACGCCLAWAGTAAPPATRCPHSGPHLHARHHTTGVRLSVARARPRGPHERKQARWQAASHAEPGLECRAELQQLQQQSELSSGPLRLLPIRGPALGWRPAVPSVQCFGRTSRGCLGQPWSALTQSSWRQVRRRCWTICVVSPSLQPKAGRASPLLGRARTAASALVGVDRCAGGRPRQAPRRQRAATPAAKGGARQARPRLRPRLGFHWQW